MIHRDLFIIKGTFISQVIEQTTKHQDVWIQPQAPFGYMAILKLFKELNPPDSTILIARI